MRRMGFGSGMVALALLACGEVAAALDWRVRIENATAHPIVAFYGSHVGLAPSDENRLGDKVLEAGSEVVLDFDDGSGYCSFDFRAVFDDGVELVRPKVNVCEVGTYRYVK